jgi:branched-chain amino acid transport system substrate-binding protein
MQRDATAKVETGGGKVLGGVRFPLNTSDMSSYLLQAQASVAKAIGVVASAADLEQSMKQGGRAIHPIL